MVDPPGLLDLGLPMPAPQAPRPCVLLIGEADFAYASALVPHVGHLAEVTATVYEAEHELLQRYPHVADTMARLRGLEAHIGFGVDARALQQHFADGSFDRVVFNLPQSPPKPKARPHTRSTAQLAHTHMRARPHARTDACATTGTHNNRRTIKSSGIARCCASSALRPR